MKDKLLLLGVAAMMVALPYCVWDSATKISELKAKCDAKHGIMMQRNKRSYCVDPSAIKYENNPQ
jgi:hypothetical protein